MLGDAPRYDREDAGYGKLQNTRPQLTGVSMFPGEQLRLSRR